MYGTERKRCKLEYLTKTLEVNEYKLLISRLDPNGYGDFNGFVTKFLADPETTDPSILRIVPMYREKGFIDIFKRKYAEKFQAMNEICTRNNLCPLFPNPSDVKESEMIRRDLVKFVPEEELNAYFGVESYFHYHPPKYRQTDEQ